MALLVKEGQIRYVIKRARFQASRKTRKQVKIRYSCLYFMRLFCVYCCCLLFFLHKVFLILGKLVLVFHSVFIIGLCLIFLFRVEQTFVIVISDEIIVKELVLTPVLRKGTGKTWK